MSRDGEGAPPAAARRIRMETPFSDLDPVERARSYPYIAPGFSYLFQGGTYRPVDAETLIRLQAGLLPVLACGSNRAPEQLARKFVDYPDIPIPVERVWLSGFDAVYAAHISGYGSISATLHPVPQVQVELSITWLDDRLLPRMDATEGRGFSYDFVRLDGLTVQGDSGQTYDQLYAYLYRGGALMSQGAPIGLTEIGASGRPYQHLRQGQVQACVMRKLGLAGRVNDFIRQNAADESRRLTREQQLQKDALMFDWPATKRLPVTD